MGKTFPLNFQNLFEINTTPGATTKTWARIAAGIEFGAGGIEDDGVENREFFGHEGAAIEIAVVGFDGFLRAIGGDFERQQCIT